MPRPGDRWKDEIDQLLKEHHAKLRSHKRHVVYVVRGRVFSMAFTPSCPYAYKNALGDLKRLLRQTGVQI